MTPRFLLLQPGSSLAGRRSQAIDVTNIMMMTIDDDVNDDNDDDDDEGDGDDDDGQMSAGGQSVSSPPPTSRHRNLPYTARDQTETKTCLCLFVCLVSLFLL